MNLSVFKNPLVIVAMIGAGIFGGVGTYIGMDCERQAAEDAAFKRFMHRSPRTDGKQYEENPFNFGPASVPTRD